MQSSEVKSPEDVEASSSRLKPFLFWGAALLVIILDQVTKTIVRESLARGESWPDAEWPVRIRYVTNTGAAFGILEDQTVFLIVMAFIGLAAIYLYYRYPPFDHFVVPIAIGMMLGGAVGNLLDRVRLGEVTDFIDFPSYPAFNVADSSIFIGITIIIVGYLVLAPRGDNRGQEPAAREDVGPDG
jgi:signal peptidase II